MPSSSTAHLVRRVTFGATPTLVADVERVGAQKWLAAQLNPAAIVDARCASVVGRFPRIAWSIEKVRSASGDFGNWNTMFDLTRATITRAAWSERQLFEVMVDLWSNHLNVTCPSSDVWDNRHDYDAKAIRRFALGKFSDLLVEASVHPAMLRYLDNASSTRTHPNENQGRELLELHTVGVDAGYSEDDVKNSARILTGLSVDNVTGVALYKPNVHHTGAVKVLGFSHPNDSADGRAVAEAYLRYLAAHPATARRIVRKLAVRFVSDSPSEALVTALAATYTQNDTAIVPVLKQLFASAEFAGSTGAKVRRPYEDLIATVRTLGLGPDAKGTEGIQALGWMSGDLGQAPLAWAPPNGYPDVAPAWQSAAGTLARWNMHLNLAANWWPRSLTRTDLLTLVPKPVPATHGALVDALSVKLLGTRMSTARRDAVCTFLDATAATALKKTSPAIGWRLPYAVALILDSPDHAVR